MVNEFSAKLEIIGINPFVYVPEPILLDIFSQAGKDKGAIPICGTVNGKPYKQSLIKYDGDWRMYINTTMLPNSPEKIGEVIHVTIAVDPEDRTLLPHPKLVAALNQNKEAQAIFIQLAPYLQKEIVRYISMLKTEESIDRNVSKAIDFLLGKGSFIGRKSL